MNLEIKKELEESILESLDRAERLKGEERATELKNVAILVDKLAADYELEEGFLDKRHKMEFDEEIERRRLELEKDKIESEYKAKGRINVNSLIGTVAMSSLALLSMGLEMRGFIPPKIFTTLFNKIGRSNKD